MGSAEWFPFFRLFPAVEVLHLSGAVGADIASSLEDIAEEVATDVFPALHTIWLDDRDDDYYEPMEVGPVELQQFLSLHRRSGHPVTSERSWKKNSKNSSPIGMARRTSVVDSSSF